MAYPKGMKYLLCSHLPDSAFKITTSSDIRQHCTVTRNVALFFFSSTKHLVHVEFHYWGTWKLFLAKWAHFRNGMQRFFQKERLSDEGVAY
jgi:hypothetical protein